jgi:phage-related protein
MEIVESIGVRVLPEMKGFREKLEAELKKVNTKFTVDIELGKVDFTKARRQIAEFQALVQSKELSLRAEVDLDSRKADKALASLHKEASNAVQGTDRLGGSVLSLLKNMTGLASGVGAATLKLGAMAGVLGFVASYAAPLSSALAGLIPVVGLIPGVVAAAVVGIGTLKLGMSGFSDVLKQMDDPAKFAEALKTLSPAAATAARGISDLKPEFDRLQLAVQERLFKNLGDEIKRTGEVLLPRLRAGLGPIASVFNGMAKDVLQFGRSSETLSALSGILIDVRLAFGNVAKGIEPILAGLRDIASVAAGMLPDLTSGFGAVAKEFAAWAKEMKDSGQMRDMIQTAIQGFKDLFKIISNVASIIGTIFGVMGETTGNFLTVLRNLTGEVATFLKSAEGTKALQVLFAGVASVVEGLKPLLLEIASVIGQYIIPALAKLGPFIADGFRALVPAIEPLGKALASLGPLIGTVAFQFAQVLAKAVMALAPVVEKLVPPLIKIIEVFGRLAGGAIDALAPLLLDLATVISEVVLSALLALEPVLPTFLQALSTMAEVLGTKLKDSLPVLVELANTLGTALFDSLMIIIPMLPQIMDAFIGILNAIIPLLPELAKLVAEALPELVRLLPLILPMLLELTAMWVQLVTDLTPFITLILESLIPAIKDFGQVAKDIIGDVKSAFGGMLDSFKGTIDLITGLFTGDWDKAWAGFKQIVQGAIDAIGGILNLAMDIFLAPIRAIIDRVTGLFGDGDRDWTQKIKDFINGIPGALGDLNGVLWEAGKSLISGFISGVKAKFNDAVNVVKGLVTTITAYFPFSPAKKGPLSGRGYTTWSGRALAEDFAKGIDSRAYLARDAITTMMELASSPVLDTFGSQIQGSVDHTMSVQSGSATTGVAEAVREGLATATFEINQDGVFKVTQKADMAFNRR